MKIFIEVKELLPGRKGNVLDAELFFRGSRYVMDGIFVSVDDLESTELVDWVKEKSPAIMDIILQKAKELAESKE